MKMRRITSALTAIACTAGMLAVFPSVADVTYAAEAVRNDFEETYEGWHGSTVDVDLVAAEGIGEAGSRGMTVTNRTSPSDGAASSKGFYLSGGISYDYSVDVYSENDETFHLSLLYIDEKTNEETVVELDSKDVKGGQWTKLSSEFKAPKDTYEYRLTITTDSTNDFTFDNVLITNQVSKNTVKAAPAGKGLKDEFANYFRVGNILNGGTVKNSSITAIMLKDHNVIECENETKPDATLVQNGSSNTNIKVSLNSCAAIADFCQKNGIGFRGHTFVWHSQTPEWFFKSNFQQSGSWVDKNTMNQRMESYIKNMFAAFAQQYPSLELFSYDVCNECVSDDSNRTKNNGGARVGGYGNGASPWVQVYGDNSFVEQAFTYARQYAPQGCKLYYNDYNEYWDHKRDCIYNMCKNLFNKGVLDGVGMQSHINADWNGFSGYDAYVTAMKKYLSIGCDVQITELDISTEGGKYSLDDQAKKYKAIFKAAYDWNKEHPDKNRVSLVQVWGPTDNNSWVGTDKASGRSNAPLLYTGNYQPKSAYTAITEIVPDSEWGDGSHPADGQPVSEPELNEEGYWFHNTFEGGTDSWSGRGSASVESASGGFNNSKALYCSGREATWNGASFTPSSRIFKPGESYSFSVNAMANEGPDVSTFKLTLQYTGSDGEPHYDEIASGAAPKGEWIQLQNADYKIPADASDMLIYVEIIDEDNLASFYVDDAIGAPAGTQIAGPGQPKVKTLILGDINFDEAIDSLDVVAGRKGIIKEISDNTAKKAADVDQSGAYELNDLVLLQEYVLGKIKEFPVNKPAVPVLDTSKYEPMFNNIQLGESFKKLTENNPIYTQRFGADPGWMVYDGRLYVYTTADQFAYKNNQMIENDYSSGYINCLSTADLVNWTDHGQIPVAKTRVNGTPIAKWANNAWAPDAAWKKINGQDKFFLYFANNGSGIGVITADDPTFTKNAKDPLGHELISRSTPNSNVTWLFDPGVYYDPNTDTAIMAYGGGVPEGQAANTKQGRIVQLGDDMISIKGTPFDPGTPYLFEDSSMIKIGDTWYYSFCHNWSVPGGTSVNGNSFASADIGYMTSKNPLGGYQYQGVVFKNTGTQRLDNGGNNHHSVIEFKGNYYVLYHSRQLEMRMGVNGGKGLNYRSPCIDKATISNGKITCSGSQNGVSQIENLNPYETVQAETMSNQSKNISVNGLGNTTVKAKKGEWIKVSGVDLSKGVSSIKVKGSGNAVVKFCVGSTTGACLGYGELNGSENELAAAENDVTGVKDIYMVFSGDCEIDYWSFS